MRILIARLLVIVTGLLIVILAVVFAAIRNASTDSQTPSHVTAAVPEAGIVPPTPLAVPDQPPTSVAVARGRAVFVEQRCQRCHSMDGEGNTRSPLDGVGGRLADKEIRLWIVAPQEMNPAVAKRGYRLSDEDLDALVAYLTSGR